MCLLQACIAASCQSPYHDHTHDHDADYDIYFFSLVMLLMLMMLMMIMIMMTLGMYAFLNMLIIFRYFEITSYTTCRGKSFVKNAMYGVCYHNDVV